MYVCLCQGLRKSAVIFKHALRNALNQVVTAITGWFAELLAGAFSLSIFLAGRGIGKITVDAGKARFSGSNGQRIVTASFFVLVNLLADVFYGIIGQARIF